MTSKLRSVREILTMDYHRAGGKGDPPREFIAGWRIENYQYGRWGLGVRFYSGSLVPIRPAEGHWHDPDEEATRPPQVKPKEELTEAQRREWRDAYFFAPSGTQAVRPPWLGPALPGVSESE